MKVLIFEEEQIKQILENLNHLEIKGVSNMRNVLGIIQLLSQGQEVNKEDITITKEGK